MQKNLLKSKILTEQTVIGSWVTLAHPAIAEIMAKAGFDWLAIDLEHSVITVREAEELIRVIDLCGVAALVRLSANDADQIKHVMDSGSSGIIVPMVMSGKDAEKAISATKYPPDGTRGIGLARAQHYGENFDSYFEWQKENSVVVVQIEHINAVNNIDEIFSVEGVDGFLIGPNDLSGSMGIPRQIDNPLYLEAVNKVKDAGKKYGITSGIHVVEAEPKKLQSAIDTGFNFVAYSLDFKFLQTGISAGLKQLNR